MKLLDLVAGSVIFSTTVDMTTVLREMAAGGCNLRPENLTVISPRAPHECPVLRRLRHRRLPHPPAPTTPP